MVSAGPETIGTVLDQIVAEVSKLAEDKAGEVRKALDDAGHGVNDVLEQAQALPHDVLEKIKDLVDPPDWWSLLLAVLVEISSLDPHLSVGVMRPAGWSRMVTLTWTGPAAETFTAGLAITDSGLKHGIMLAASAPIETTFGDDLRVEVSAQDEGRWTWEFGGPVEAPVTGAVLAVDLSWKSPVPQLEAAAGDLTVGRLHLHATLAKSPTEPLYTVLLGLGLPNGAPGDAGLRAALRAGQALGALATMVSIADLDERYSPQVTIAAGRAPQFTLNHSGL